MNNDKLGFSIKRASAGAGTVIECNPGPWTNKVVDVRERLKLFQGLVPGRHFLTSVSFDAQGCLLTLLTPIAGRVGDFLSGWVHIPSHLQLSGHDIAEVCHFVRSTLQQSQLDAAGIQNFFARTYPSRAYALPYPSSQGELFGLRYLNEPHSLEHLLDDENRYQAYYGRYKAIFLVDRAEDIALEPSTVAQFHDLTQQPLLHYTLLLPPTPEQLQRLQGKLYVNDQPYERPTLQAIDQALQVELRREGFESQRYPLTPSQAGQQYIFDLLPAQASVWSKVLTPLSFNVCDRETRKKPGGTVTITINGKRLTAKGMLLEEEVLRNVEIRITHPDYEDYLKKGNLVSFSPKSPLSITLTRKTISRVYSINLKRKGSSTPHQAKVTFESQYLSKFSQESPIEGYKVSNNNRLIWDTSRDWQQRIMGFVAGCGVTLLLAGAWGLWNYLSDDKSNKSDQTSQAQKDAATNAGSTTSNDANFSEETELQTAINYLSETTMWKKDEMENISRLRGLFDAMNEFRLEDIRDKYSSDLQRSERFSRLLEVIKKNIVNNWNPAQAPHNPTYNKSGDNVINVEDYIQWLNQDRRQKEDVVLKPESPSTPKQETSGRKESKKNEKSADKKPADKKPAGKTNVNSSRGNGGL